MRPAASIFASLAVLPLILFSTTSPALAQQGTIAGRVLTEETAEPIAGASVSIAGTARGAVTNDLGEYRLDTTAGIYTLRARSIAYRDAEERVTVQSGETITVDFRLASAPLLVDQIVAIGSRTTRTETETPVPVDVLSSEEIEASGHTEVNQLLAVAVPSFNASHQTIADGTDHINPASLRGLGPDQVLVLVNGKRRHQSALVHVNGTFGRGTVGVDLNAIPTAAIKRVEVLRDGASAQYGSDAISGVINLVLEDQTEALKIDAQGGQTGEGDGEQLRVDANYGFDIADRGFFNVTGMYLDRGRTDRSDPWTGDIFPGITGTEATDAELRRRGLTRRDFSIRTGQGEAVVGTAFWNSIYPLSGNAELYSFGGISHREGAATGFYRLPNQEAQVVPEIVPNGFLPEINPKIDDVAGTAGVRGTRSGWDMDFSVTHGRNSFLYNIDNSVNASIGPSSPTTFDAGELEFRQSVGNLDIVRLIDTGGAVRSMSLVLGSEYRVENYRIEAGQPESYLLGNGGDIAGVDFDTTSSGGPKAAGSQVFPGFQPANEVDRFRTSISGYVGLESELTDRFLLDVGGRAENYTDFGSTVTGKIAARYEVTEPFALRGAVSNGFRAPSLHQVWFNNVSTQFLFDPETGTLEPRQVLTSSNQSRITKAFGVPDLDEETSVNVSAGFIARPRSNLSITADYYRIDIDDRIVLTSQFSNANPIVATILEPFSREGVTAAQFFANAVDTKTQGVDVVVSYATAWGLGTLDLSGSVNFTDTEVLRINVPAEMAEIFAGGDLEAVRTLLFNREESNRLESALPTEKFNLSARYTQGPLSLYGAAAFFGEIEYLPPDPVNDETFGAKTIFDADVSYELFPGVKLSVGANNAFNTFPDEHEKEANIDRGRFPFSRRVTQFGSNGGFYYGRIRLTL
jgi:iron complex outermembrane receptor protein